MWSDNQVCIELTSMLFYYLNVILNVIFYFLLFMYLNYKIIFIVLYRIGTTNLLYNLVSISLFLFNYINF